MMKAYVVLRIDNATRTVDGVGIYSAGWEGLMLRFDGRYCYANALVTTGETYQKAIDTAMEALRASPGTRWMAEWIEGGKREVGG